MKGWSPEMALSSLAATGLVLTSIPSTQPSQRGLCFQFLKSDFHQS